MSTPPSRAEREAVNAFFNDHPEFIGTLFYLNNQTITHTPVNDAAFMNSTRHQAPRTPPYPHVDKTLDFPNHLANKVERMAAQVSGARSNFALPICCQHWVRPGMNWSLEMYPPDYTARSAQIVAARDVVEKLRRKLERHQQDLSENIPSPPRNRKQFRPGMYWPATLQGMSIHLESSSKTPVRMELDEAFRMMPRWVQTRYSEPDNFIASSPLLTETNASRNPATYYDRRRVRNLISATTPDDTQNRELSVRMRTMWDVISKLSGRLTNEDLDNLRVRETVWNYRTWVLRARKFRVVRMLSVKDVCRCIEFYLRTRTAPFVPVPVHGPIEVQTSYLMYTLMLGHWTSGDLEEERVPFEENCTQNMYIPLVQHPHHENLLCVLFTVIPFLGASNSISTRDMFTTSNSIQIPADKYFSILQQRVDTHTTYAKYDEYFITHAEILST